MCKSKEEVDGVVGGSCNEGKMIIKKNETPNSG